MFTLGHGERVARGLAGVGQKPRTAKPESSKRNGLKRQASVPVDAVVQGPQGLPQKRQLEQGGAGEREGRECGWPPTAAQERTVGRSNRGAFKYVW